MVYKALGLMSGSSLDGLDLAYVHFHETAGKWSFEIIAAECFTYSPEWTNKLKTATAATAMEYLLLHSEYGHYLGEQVNRFIAKYNLEHQVDLIGSHGHTSFHHPRQRMTAQLGDGAAIAAVTALPVVSDLRALDVALGGQGAPIVPIGEKLLFADYEVLLNLGGIANLSIKTASGYIAFDVCAANRVLNMLAGEAGKIYDEGGAIAASGKLHQPLLNQLNALEYYRQPFPKSLANEFGTAIIYPLIKSFHLPVADALHTYTMHIAMQIDNSLRTVLNNQAERKNMLISGGGALNNFLVQCIMEVSSDLQVEIMIPTPDIINYKEALIMALIGVLRWREEYNVLSSVTGASKDSIGGALWLGGEA